VLARGDSNAGATKKGPLVRRHSSGDHVFLPTRGETAAKKLAGRGGIQEGQVADSEVSAAPPARAPIRILKPSVSSKWQGLSLPSVHEASLANK